TPLLEDSRLLLANTLLLAEETQARLLTITGLQDSLESSMIALHLARLLAQCRCNVLLVDANLAHPMQHIWNEKPLQGGLVELLEFAQDADRESIRGKGQFRPKIREPGVSPIGRYLQRTALPSLQLLPAGKAQRDPATILGMSALPQLLHQALNFVDFVIIDCPSFSQAEVHLLGASSDQLLLVVNSACNRLPQIEQAIENFSQAGIKPGGLIVVQSRLNHRFQAGGDGSL
ncbi:MAG TPA: hypothetical protein VFN23_15805, partial [Ktedonobacteraceae bacterium]|nr:hypothetical protein [Ktedonobacteraceae bacterium]